jgi:hypothetical protein
MLEVKAKCSAKDFHNDSKEEELSKDKMYAEAVVQGVSMRGSYAGVFRPIVRRMASL